MSYSTRKHIYMELPLKTDVEVFDVVICEGTQGHACLAQEVVTKRVFIEYHKTERFPEHGIVCDAEVCQRFIPLRTQGLGYRLCPQLRRLQEKTNSISLTRNTGTLIFGNCERICNTNVLANEAAYLQVFV